MLTMNHLGRTGHPFVNQIEIVYAKRLSANKERIRSFYNTAKLFMQSIVPVMLPSRHIHCFLCSSSPMSAIITV